MAKWGRVKSPRQPFTKDGVKTSVPSRFWGCVKNPGQCLGRLTPVGKGRCSWSRRSSSETAIMESPVLRGGSFEWAGPLPELAGPSSAPLIGPQLAGPSSGELARRRMLRGGLYDENHGTPRRENGSDSRIGAIGYSGDDEGSMVGVAGFTAGFGRDAQPGTGT